MFRKFAVSLILIISLYGCATEPIKCLLGISTKTLENVKTQGISKIYERKKDICFDAALVVLKELNAYVHIKNRQRSIITAMNFRKIQNTNIEDTTELAIIFEKIDLNKTKITITSLSKSLLDEYSKKIFDNLDKELAKEAF